MDSGRRQCQEWRCTDRITLVTLHILLLISTSKCETVHKDESNFREIDTKNNKGLDNNIESRSCHSCQNKGGTNVVTSILNTIDKLSEKYVSNNTERVLKVMLEKTLDEVLNKDKFELFDGIEIKVDEKNTSVAESTKARALFSSYTYEYRLLQKIKNFFNTHIMSINLPKATGLINFRSFGLKKFFWPLLIGFQIFKSILLAMFLPSLLGSFGKILGKGLSQLSAASSQASYPPANADEPTSYNDNKNFMGYDTNQAESYLYAQDGDAYGNMDGAETNDLSSLDITRFGASGQKVSYLPTKNNYYKNQMAQAANNYKTFQKIPASSMILSNYDPFYSPLLSRLDGIFARLGLAPTDGASDDGQQIGGQSLSTVKLEACREQLICLMYSSPAKYAPYSNLVSAQLSRELNELRRPVSDNPEILRFFRYMRAARQGQEGIDCTGAHAACSATTSPSHTMIAAYQDINKLVTARKL